MSIQYVAYLNYQIKYFIQHIYWIKFLANILIIWWKDDVQSHVA